MTKEKNSQTQKDETKPAAAFDPMATFGKLTEDHMARAQAFYDELAGWEAKAYDRSKDAMEQISTMATQSLAYASALASEWRNLTLEATRRGAEFFSAR